MNISLKAIKFFFYLILFYEVIFCEKIPDNPYPKYRCGSNKIKPIPRSPIKKAQIQNDNGKIKRSLDSGGFKDFNIFLDLFNFDDEIKKYKLTDKREFFVEGMQKAIKTIQSLLKVKTQESFSFYDEDLLKYSIYNWDKTKIGTEMTEKRIGLADLGIDLYVCVRFADYEELGENILASAGVYYLNSETGQPLLGIININREVDYSKKNSLRYFSGLILHEFTHILGFSSWYFIEYYHNYFTKLDKNGIERAFVNSNRVLKVAREYFNCPSLEGVELENFGGEGTVGSHWEARILLGEYMTGYMYTPNQVISEFTLALLEDSGYYKAKYYTGGLMQFGKNKGCEFIESECINNRKINPNFSNEFYDKIYNRINQLDSSCSTGRQSRAYHGLVYYDYDIPKKYQYFNYRNRGGSFDADYCPVSLDFINEIQDIYYVGHCSEIGGDNYGSEIPYIIGGRNIYYKSGKIASKTGEYHSSSSFCVLSTLISKKVSDYANYSKTLRAVCFQMHCSDRSLTIQINDNYFVCPRAGGKINALNFDGYLLCPDYNLICSGTVLCNDMFDCVEKKSIIKNITYDYISRTSQDYGEISKEKIRLDGYELSNNGQCPLNCHQCNNLGECLVCKEGTFLNGKKECENCPPGQYSLKGENKCKYCSAGQYSEEGASQCKKCEAGFYSNEGADQCLKCPIGYYSSDGASSCKTCSNGQYLLQDKCFTCEAGTFSLSGSITCTSCSAGTYSNKGASSCKQCPAGKYSNEGSSSCNQCPAGTYSNKGSSSCIKCEAGYYSNKGASQCSKCKAGTYSIEGSSSCNKCPSGTYSLQGSSSCIKCPIGSYSSEGASSCKNCTAGQYLLEDTCYICGAGTYSKSGSITCTSCSAGTYSNKGASSCKQCPAGKYSNEGSSSCNQCPAGTYSNQGSGSCIKCEAGYYSNKGASQCSKCKAGTFSIAGSSSCNKCPAGYYSSEGAYSCRKCLIGSYSSEGASSCKNCSDGQYLVKDKCYTCGAGTYSKSGSILCIDCSAGTYSNKGSGSCIKCKAGYYSNKGDSQCSKCKAGTYSIAGSSSCYKCAAGYYSSDGASTCKMCKAGTYSLGGAKNCISCPKGKTSKAGSSYCN